MWLDATLIKPGVSSLASSAPFRLPTAPAATDLVAKYVRGLGDPIRLRILELLRDEGELSVGDLDRRLGLPAVEGLKLSCLSAVVRFH